MDQLLSHWKLEKVHGSDWPMDQAQNTGHHGEAMEKTEDHTEKS
jgi:hypothetical protein